MTDLEIKVCGERVLLSPERALFLPEHDTVLVADLHWGKAAAFRAAHVPIPTGTTASDLARLSRVQQVAQNDNLLRAGGVQHAKAGRQQGTLDTIAAWRVQHADIHMRLVRGNHDTHAGDPPSSLDIDCVDAPWTLGPFVCAHHPEPHAAGYVLSGHLHPHVTLGRRGEGRVKLPCFVFGEHVGILPAFTEFSGSGAYRAAPDDQLFAIVERQVIAVQ